MPPEGRSILIVWLAGIVVVPYTWHNRAMLVLFAAAVVALFSVFVATDGTGAWRPV